MLLIALDLALMFPRKRRFARRELAPVAREPSFTVALTAYNDEASIYNAVRDFLAICRDSSCHCS